MYRVEVAHSKVSVHGDYGHGGLVWFNLDMLSTYPLSATRLSMDKQKLASECIAKGKKTKLMNQSKRNMVSNQTTIVAPVDVPCLQSSD